MNGKYEEVLVVELLKDGDEGDSDIEQIIHTVVSRTGNANECNNDSNECGNRMQEPGRQIQNT